MRRMQGKTMLVTGAASAIGIGFAIARCLAQEGACVVLTDIAEDAVRARATELRQSGFNAIGLQHDVADEESWQRVLSEIEQEVGVIDGLVNNAGIAILVPVSDLTSSDFRRLLDINLTGAFIGSKLVIERMRQYGIKGSIVNISSVSGLVGIAGTAGYGASKGGMRLLTKGLAMEVAADGIRCNSVHPGAIWSDIQHAAIASAPESFGQSHIEGMIPLGRIGDPEDVARAVLFLTSDDSSYITGIELAVDGGLTAG